MLNLHLRNVFLRMKKVNVTQRNLQQCQPRLLNLKLFDWLSAMEMLACHDHRQYYGCTLK